MKISITGDLGSGKSTIAKIVCTKLNYKYISTGYLHRKIAEEYKVDSLELNKIAFEDSYIDDKIDGYLKSLNTDTDNIIIDSRMAWHFVEDTFKIFFEINSELGAERIFNDKSRFNEPKYHDENSALKNILERKGVEDERFFNKYNVECANLTNYDLVINTSVGSIDSICDLLISLIRLKENGIIFPKFWVSPKFLYPTENIRIIGRDETYLIKTDIKKNGFDSNYPLECINHNGYYYIWDGHKRYSGALYNNIEFIPIEVIARDNEEIINGQYVNDFVSNSINISLYHDWEDAHDFIFINYPKI